MKLFILVVIWCGLFSACIIKNDKEKDHSTGTTTTETSEIRDTSSSKKEDTASDDIPQPPPIINVPVSDTMRVQ